MKSISQINHLDETKLIGTSNSKLCSPIIVEDEIYCVSESGDILKFNAQGDKEIVFTILGHPSSLAFREGQNSFLIADFAHQSIFSRQENSNFEIQNLVTQYHDRAYLGPHSIRIGPFSKNMYFTDSGPFQETSIENKSGSVFVYQFENRKVKCLSHRNLAYPAGIEVDEEQKYLLVCEMGQNRIVKILLDESLSGNSTIFHQFCGRFGPSSIIGYENQYYVSLFEFEDLSPNGVIAILNTSGEYLQKIIVGTGPEISGIWIDVEPEGDQEVILISEGNKLFKTNLKKGGDSESKLEESIVIPK